MTSNRRIHPAAAPASAPAPFRLSHLARACLVASGAVVAFGAAAQQSNYLTTATSPYSLAGVSGTAATGGFAFFITSYTSAAQPEQFNSGNNLANFPDPITVGTNVTGGTGPNTVTSNSFAARARGNSVSNAIVPAPAPGALTGLLVNNGTEDGLGIAYTQANAPDGGAGTGQQIASITGLTLQIQLDATAPDTHNISSNSVASSSILNLMDNVILGMAPVGYVSTTLGTSSTTYDTTSGIITTTSGGGLSINAAQTAVDSARNAGSMSEVVDTTVMLDIQASTAAQTAPLIVTSNQIGATFGGNVVLNAIQTTASPAATSFTGAASLVNTQVNVETGAASTTPTASVANGQIVADIRDRTGGNTTLSSTLDLASNTIAAVSTGNSAGTSTSTGNSIRFDAGTAVTGVSTGNVTGVTADGATGTYSASPTADVSIANLQANVTTGIASDTTGAVIRVKTDEVDSTGVVNASSNGVTSAAFGNTANNLVTGIATAFNATVGVASVQANNTTDVTADNLGTTIGAQVGITGADIAGIVNVTSNYAVAQAIGSSNTSSVVLSPTNTLTAVGTTPSGSTFTADNAGLADGQADAGIVINTVQNNSGAANVISNLTDASIFLNVVDEAAGTPATVLGGTLSATGNRLENSAIGNKSANTLVPLNSLALTGNAVALSAVVGSAQSSDSTVSATTSGQTGVTVLAGGVTDGKLDASSNKVLATGTGNETSNLLSVSANTLTMGPTDFSTNTAQSNATGGVVATSAAFSAVSSQYNAGSVASSNTTSSAFAQITAGDTGGIIGSSSLGVSGNEARSTTTANKATNSLALAPGLLTAAGDVPAQVGAVANLQTNASAATESATVGGEGGPLQAIGITYLTSVDTAVPLTVTGNTAAAQARGNDATNVLQFTNAGYTTTGTAPTPSGVLATSQVDDTSLVSNNNEFAVLNQQNDGASSRTATADNMRIGIENSGDINAMNGILTVTGNTVMAEARNNNAANGLTVNGTSGNVTTSAGVISQQYSTAVDTQSIVNVEIGATVVSPTVLTDVTAQIDVASNKSSALAYGNVAGNAVTAGAVILTGNANITTGEVRFDGTGLSVASDFAAGNVQNTTSALLADSTASVRINLDSSAVVGSTLNLTGNVITAEAQSNSARSTVDLKGTTVTASAAVGNAQIASGNVEARHVGSATSDAFTVSNTLTGSSIDTTAITVSENKVIVNAGQNAADNWITANATSLLSRGLGTNEVTSTGFVQATTDLGVANSQTSTAGDVTATALTPGDIGVRANSITGNTVAVTTNSIATNATVNNASNVIQLLGPNSTPVSIGLSAGIASQQVTAGTQVTSTVGDGTTIINVGIVPETAMELALSGVTVNVTGNTLSSLARGNNATNSVAATAVAGLTAPAAGQSLTVLNDQQNAAALNATTENAAFGVNASAGGGGASALDTVILNVTGNHAFATAGANTVTNSVSAAADTINGGGTDRTFLLTNSQQNAATGDALATVQNIDAGVNVSGSTAPLAIDSSTVNVLSNQVQASAYGNSATSTLSQNAVTGTSVDVNSLLDSTQSNLADIEANTNTVNIGVMAAGQTVSATTVTVSGNTVSGTAGGSTATNLLNVSAGAVLADASTQPTYQIINNQDNQGAITSNTATVLIGSNADVLGTAGSPSPLSVLNNQVLSTAYGNNVRNTVQLTAVAGSATSMSGDLGTTQTNTGAITSAINTVDVGLFSTGAGTNVEVSNVLTSGNKVESVAGANTSQNVLNMTAGSAIGTAVALPTYNLSNAQDNTAAVDSQVNTVRIGADLAGDVVGIAALNALGNTITARAYGNSSDNRSTLVASAGSTALFQGYVTNVQTQSGAISASVGTALDTIQVGLGVAGTATDAASTVSGNTVNAIAGANTTTNVLNALTGSYFGTPVTAPGYLITNSQLSNGATVMATATNVNIGFGAANITTSAMSVLGNSILASGYGNLASNTLGVTAPITGASMVASAGIASSQVNTANVTATVSGGRIGVFGSGFAGATTGSGSNPFIVTGNSITAQAVGNSATNIITTR